MLRAFLLLVLLTPACKSSSPSGTDTPALNNTNSPTCPDEQTGDDDETGDHDETEERNNIPIIFVHGQGGSLRDWQRAMHCLIETDARWDGFVEAGVASHATWADDAFPQSFWLFNFTYYSRMPSDSSDDYTAGPGRIGSDGEYWCEDHEAWGRLPATDERYYDEAFVHEYARDLAEFITSVLAVTGSPQVDIVAHSMGGLVTRAAIQFIDAFQARAVRRVMLVATPNHGLDIAELGFLDPNKPSWMRYGEFAELDAVANFWNFSFHVCDTTLPSGSWTEGLNSSDDEAASYVTYYVISGEDDPHLTYATADYDQADWHVVVPDADHTTIRSAPETCQAIAVHLGSKE